MEEAKALISKLVEKYEAEKIAGRINKYTEAETKSGFIEPLFEALGWNFSSKQEVTLEENISGDRVDYGFYLNGRTKFYLEAKPFKVDLHKPEYARQAIRYSFNKGVTWAVLTDFESLIVFNAQLTDKSLSSKLFFEIPYNEFISRFDQLWSLSKSAFEQDLIDKEAEKIGKKLQRVAVGEKLYKDLNESRRVLSESFRVSNDKLSKAIIDEGVQKLIDRLIFIRVAEDRKIEPQTLIPILRQWQSSGRQLPLYRSMIEKFRELDKTYNSNLFTHHAFEDWAEDHGATEKVIKILYGSEGYYEYDFSAIPADVLGSVYENYLGYKLQQSGKDESDELSKDSRKRKEHGIYYTPRFIVEYIVKNALGPILDKCKSINDLQKIKVLDPACGSGSFLIWALDLIAQKYQDFGQKPDALTKLQIVTNNLYGVDLDEQAVELARLNLLLNCFDEQIKLPNLDHNIKHGNSLISGTDQELQKYFGKNFRDKHPFNWEEQFPTVFKQGGFDVVIGNPPWVTVTHKQLGPGLVDFFKNKYAGAVGFKLNLFPLFVELSLDLLKADGVVSLIIPNRLLDTPSYKGVRSKFINKYEVLDILNIPSGAFEEVVAGNIILTIQKSKNTKKEIIISKFNTDSKLKIKISDIIANENLTININSQPETTAVIKKIKQAKTVALKEIFDIHVGMMVKDKAEKFSKEPISGDQIVVGKDLARYFVRSKSYFDIKNIEIFGGTKNPKKHSEYPKLLVRKTGNNIICALDHEGVYAEQSVYLVLPRDKNFNIKFICGYLNSKLVSFYFQSELITNPEAYPYIQHYDLESIPVIQTEQKNQTIIANLVDKITDLNSKLEKTKPDTNEWEKLKDEIEKTDRKIDDEVYKLYGLNDEEIKIIKTVSKNN